MEEMRRRLNAAEREAEEMSARLSSEELSYEAKLTEVYNAHRERVECPAGTRVLRLQRGVL